ncbi:hypothetical protein [Clostridium magnum]|uniref:Uncharacterized protein n=1 Tax=Clostridium magnum DSM 2767 TaxID=1121326 RepID=A0A161Y399_9CLOT|nr:hypothetical protein [Clostridium magnum]KZL92489.1 hypothetical protein CLMAG_22980 [Clostridium magnum DSM 2767]SHI26369.1 hypothetical protein SAMN02745944_03744 [Clostridium magnum DSM 2767]
MKNKYSNSLDNVMTKYKNDMNDITIIDKGDIMAMFNTERPKKKGRFRIFN